MKKVLLGTSALVSAGLVAQHAQAADPIELSLGGYQTWGFYAADVGDNPQKDGKPAEPGFNREHHDLFFDGEIHFKGSTVLDNGLEVGIRFELEGEEQDGVQVETEKGDDGKVTEVTVKNKGDQLDETYVYVEGAFGRLQIGNDDSAAHQMATAAPYLNYIFGANSPTVYANGLSNYFERERAAAGGALKSRFAAGATTTWSTFAAYGGDQGRVMYFTPVFNGFQFAVSYAPSAGETGNGGAYALPGKTDSAAMSVAGRYDGTVGDVGVTASAGYRDINKKDSVDSGVWNAGLVLSMHGWSVGGSYQDVSDMGNVADTDSQTFDLGVSYTSDGPWAVGVYWLNSEIDYAADTLLAGSGVTDEFDAYRLQGSYNLGPGIALHGTLGMDTFDDGVVNTDYDSTFVGSAIKVSF